MFSRPSSKQKPPNSCPSLTQNINSQCPFMQHRQDHKQDNNNYSSKSDGECEEEQKPQGGCPFMQSTGKKSNPALRLSHSGFEQPFISKFKFYLSEDKMNIENLKNPERKQMLQRETFNKYPIYLQHTLFYQGEDLQKIRSFECCSRFLAYEKLREKGNQYFSNGKYKKALEFYERAMSLFRWLQYKEKQAKGVCQSQENKLMVPSQSQCYEETSEEQISDKWKQLFIIYDDSNVVYSNGEGLSEEVDVDLRKSLLIQVYLNMAAAYIKLNHFSLATNIVQDGIELSEGVSQLLLRKSQAVLANAGASWENLVEAKCDMMKALEMRANERILQETNHNVLKMMNLHDAKEVYNEVLLQVEKKMQTYAHLLNEAKSKVENRLFFLDQTEKQIISEGKVPIEGKENKLFSQKSEYKVLMKMKQKYETVLQYYCENNNEEGQKLGKKQFEQLLKVISQIKFIENIQVENDWHKFGSEENKVLNRIKNIKKEQLYSYHRLCEDIYHQTQFNFQAVEWAIKEVVEQEFKSEEVEKRSERRTEECCSSQERKETKTLKLNFVQKVPYSVLLLPAIGLLVRYLL